MSKQELTAADVVRAWREFKVTDELKAHTIAHGRVPVGCRQGFVDGLCGKPHSPHELTDQEGYSTYYALGSEARRMMEGNNGNN